VYRSTQAANGFTTLMQGGKMKKEYFAKVRKIDLRQAAQGLPGWATLTCVGPGVYRLDAPIRTKDPMVGSMCCAEDGKEASTLFEVVEGGGGGGGSSSSSSSSSGGNGPGSDAMVVRATLIHGRTHQIRVHCALLHMPILNDPCYGPEEYVQQYQQEYRPNRGSGKGGKGEEGGRGGKGGKGERNEGNGDTGDTGKGGDAGEKFCNGAAAVPTVAEREDGHQQCTAAAAAASMTKEEAAQSICSYCQRGETNSFSKSQLRHEGIWLHSFRYSMDDGGTKWSYQTEVPDWAKV